MTRHTPGRRDGAQASTPPPDTIDGTVDVIGMDALPPGSTVSVTLEDVSRQDVRSETIGSQVLDAAGPLPLRFAIRYDGTSIDDRHAYAIRATVTVDGRLRFTTDAGRPVITRGAPTSVALSLVPVNPQEVRRR